MNISIKAVRPLLAAVVAIVVLGASASAASAAPGPALWKNVRWGTSQSWSLSLQVGTNAPINCGVTWSGNALNEGSPIYPPQLQAVFYGFKAGSSCFSNPAVVDERGHKDGGNFWMTVKLPQVVIADAAGTWTVNNAAFSAAWTNPASGGSTSTLTFAPGTQIGTTTTGLPVTIAGSGTASNVQLQ